MPSPMTLHEVVQNYQEIQDLIYIARLHADNSEIPESARKSLNYRIEKLSKVQDNIRTWLESHQAINNIAASIHVPKGVVRAVKDYHKILAELSPKKPGKIATLHSAFQQVRYQINEIYLSEQRVHDSSRAFPAEKLIELGQNVAPEYFADNPKLADTLRLFQQYENLIPVSIANILDSDNIFDALEQLQAQFNNEEFMTQHMGMLTALTTNYLEVNRFIQALSPHLEAAGLDPSQIQASIAAPFQRLQKYHLLLRDLQDKVQKLSYGDGDNPAASLIEDTQPIVDGHLDGLNELHDHFAGKAKRANDLMSHPELAEAHERVPEGGVRGVRPVSFAGRKAVRNPLFPPFNPTEVEHESVADHAIVLESVDSIEDVPLLTDHAMEKTKKFIETEHADEWQIDAVKGEERYEVTFGDKKPGEKITLARSELTATRGAFDELAQITGQFDDVCPLLSSPGNDLKVVVDAFENMIDNDVLVSIKPNTRVTLGQVMDELPTEKKARYIELARESQVSLPEDLVEFINDSTKGAGYSP